MRRIRNVIFMVLASIVMLGSYYQFGYPLKDLYDVAMCEDAYLATATVPYGDVFLPTERAVSKSPRVRCGAAVVVDNATKEILYQRNAEKIVPIASISKLLTALVLIDLDLDWASVVQISREDAYHSARSHMKIGEMFYSNDLFYVMLISSDNRAARALARSTGLSHEQFAALMNKKAKSLGMYDTEMFEPTGLDDRNVSTAMDCARLINAAFDQKLISNAARTERYSFRSLNHKRRRNVVNTNRLLKSQWKVRGGKTGYISESGYCFATRLCDGNNHDITVVVLGAPGPSRRFGVARTLASWAFKNLNRFDQEGHHAERGSD